MTGEQGTDSDRHPQVDIGGKRGQTREESRHSPDSMSASIASSDRHLSGERDRLETAVTGLGRRRRLSSGLKHWVAYSSQGAACAVLRPMDEPEAISFL